MGEHSSKLNTIPMASFSLSTHHLSAATSAYNMYTIGHHSYPCICGSTAPTAKLDVPADIGVGFTVLAAALARALSRALCTNFPILLHSLILFIPIFLVLVLEVENEFFKVINCTQMPLNILLAHGHGQFGDRMNQAFIWLNSFLVP